MHRLIGTPALLSSWASAACAVSWLVVLVCVPVVVQRLWRSARFELVIPGVLGLIAFALRMALPWGPLNFVDAERLGPLWLREFWADPLFASVPTALDGLTSVGFSPAFLMRTWGQLFGALAVVATYAAARALRLSVAPAAFAATFVAFFPPHVHFSTGPVLSIEAGALCIAAVAVAAALPSRVTVVLLAALTTLGVYTRPECRLLVLPVALLVFRREWAWRDRLILFALLAAALGAYVPLALSPSTLASPVPECMKRFTLSLLHNPISFGLPWILAALAGISVGATSIRNRVALALLLLGVGITDVIGGSDPSPQWGQWRYFVVLVPFVAVAAAALIERVKVLANPVAWVALLALAIAPLAPASATLRASNDQQAEYAFVRETTPRVLELEAKPTLYVLRAMDTSTPRSSALMALASVVGPFEGLQWGCKFPLPPDPILRVRVIDSETLRCPNWIEPSRPSYLLVGPHEAGPLLDLLRSRFELVPTNERAQRVVPDSPPADNGASCSMEDGLKGPTEKAHFAWYRISARPSPP